MRACARVLEGKALCLRMPRPPTALHQPTLTNPPTHPPTHPRTHQHGLPPLPTQRSGAAYADSHDCTPSTPSPLSSPPLPPLHTRSGAVRLYADFHDCDVVVASPLALSTLLAEGEAAGGKEGERARGCVGVCGRGAL